MRPPPPTLCAARGLLAIVSCEGWPAELSRVLAAVLEEHRGFFALERLVLDRLQVPWAGLGSVARCCAGTRNSWFEAVHGACRRQAEPPPTVHRGCTRCCAHPSAAGGGAGYQRPHLLDWAGQWSRLGCAAALPGAGQHRGPACMRAGPPEPLPCRQAGLINLAVAATLTCCLCDAAGVGGPAEARWRGRAVVAAVCVHPAGVQPR